MVGNHHHKIMIDILNVISILVSVIRYNMNIELSNIGIFTINVKFGILILILIDFHGNEIY